MAPEKRPPRRPVVGSRNPTGRPRTVAGRRDLPEPRTTEPPAAEVTEDPAPEPPETREAPETRERVERPYDSRADRDVQGPVPDARSPQRLLQSLRTTVVLVVALVLLAGAVAAEAWYLWFKDDPVVSAARPVVTGEVTHRAAVEAASTSTADILSYGHKDFDEQIDEATTKMTDSFAAQFRETAAGVKEEFVAAKTEQEMRVVAASVVRASPDQVQALLFLDQYVANPGEPTDRTPFRALVTVVHTDGGWLVSDIATR